MAEPTIKNGEEHFFPIIFEGNGGGQKIGKFVPFDDSSGGTIANSLIFNRADNPYMYFNKSSITPDSDKKFTFSCWFKLGELGSANNTGLFNSNTDGSNGGNVTRYAPLAIFYSSNTIFGYDYDSGGYNWYYAMNRVFKDTSKWYHFVIAFDTTQSTDTDRMKIYIDGEQITSFSSITYPALNQDLYTVMAGGYHILGLGYNAKFDGYLAEVNLIENQMLTPASFGITDTSSGRWVPKSLSGLNYGTNGFRLQFGSPSNLGDDTSGNTKDFSVSNLVAGDQTTDSPTQNFATGFTNQASGNSTFSEGNLKASQGSNTSNMGSMRSTLRLDPKSDTGYYCEYTVGAENGGNGQVVGVIDVRADGVKSNSSHLRFSVGNNFMFACDTYVVRETNGTDAGTGNNATINPEFTTGDVMGIAFKKGKVWIAKNNTWSNSGNPSAGTGHLVDLSNETLYRFYAGQYGASGGNDGTFNFGQKSLTYTAPTGFVSLQQDNMPETAKGVSGLSWMKDRESASYSHFWFDSNRGQGKALKSNSSNGESSYSPNELKKFLKGGFSVGNSSEINRNAISNVAWNWVANGGTKATNEVGAITSTVQANTDAGFSIVEYTGTGGAASVGHGLSAAPEWMIFKDKGSSSAWRCYHKSLGGITKYIVLNTTAAVATASMWGAPTASAFIIGGTGYEVNESGNNYIAYCWHSVDGFSKFGKYEGNNNANGTFVNLGFKPAFVMIKGIDSSSSSYPWAIYDNRRSPTNPVSLLLEANATTVENTLDRIDFLSNGFKLRQSYSYSNAGETYVYVAFAEHPFVGDGTNPVTAR